MGLVEAFVFVEGLFKEATSIATPEVIDQAGEYLLFDGVSPANETEMKVSFIVVLCANSYTHENGLASLIDERVKRVNDSSFDVRIKRLQRANILSTTLYSVAMHIEVLINAHD